MSACADKTSDYNEKIPVLKHFHYTGNMNLIYLLFLPFRSLLLQVVQLSCVCISFISPELYYMWHWWANCTQMFHLPLKSSLDVSGLCLCNWLFVKKPWHSYISALMAGLESRGLREPVDNHPCETSKIAFVWFLWNPQLHRCPPPFFFCRTCVMMTHFLGLKSTYFAFHPICIPLN